MHGGAVKFLRLWGIFPFATVWLRQLHGAGQALHTRRSFQPPQGPVKSVGQRGGYPGPDPDSHRQVYTVVPGPRLPEIGLSRALHIQKGGGMTLSNHPQHGGQLKVLTFPFPLIIS